MTSRSLHQAIEASGKCEMEMLGAGMGWKQKWSGMGGDGDICMRGQLGMDTELAGTDGDGDKCMSPCSSPFHTTHPSKLIILLSVT